LFCADGIYCGHVLTSSAIFFLGLALCTGVKAKSTFVVTPGSEQIRATIARDGQMEVLEKAGATVLGTAHGATTIPYFRQRLI